MNSRWKIWSCHALLPILGLATAIVPNRAAWAETQEPIQFALSPLAAVEEPMAPSILEQPLSFEADAGYRGTIFTVVAAGNPAPSYQWLFNGTPIPDATLDYLYSPGVLVTDTGRYSVIVSNELGTLESVPVELTVRVYAPSITLQPTNRTVAAGRYASFRVEAEGAPPPLFQWLFDGAPLAGATNALLELFQVSAAHAGGYSVVVTNTKGAVTSLVARLTVTPPPTNAGALDENFLRQAPPGFNWLARAILLQPDGRIIVGGRFLQPDGTAQAIIARLLPDGGIDPSFDASEAVNGELTGAALTADGKIIVAGRFFGSPPYLQVARLHPDGSLDTNFLSRTWTLPELLQSRVLRVGVQRSGHIILAGNYRLLVRLNPDGSMNRSAILPPLPGSLPGSVNPPGRLNDVSLAMLGGDRFCVSIDYTGLGRYLPEGDANPTFYDFDLGPFAQETLPIPAIVETADGRLILGGSFPIRSEGRSVALVRLLRNGARDSAFAPELPPNSRVTALALQSNGQLLVAVQFPVDSGPAASRLVRLHADGALDPNFDSGHGFQTRFGYPGSVTAIQPLPDCRILVGGSFSLVDGAARTNLAVLLNDPLGPPVIVTPPTNQVATSGTDTFFHVGTPCVPLAFQWQRNGTNLPAATNALLRLRQVTAENDAGTYTVVISNALGRVVSDPVTLAVVPPSTADGTVDPSFDPGLGADGGVRALVRQGDGRLLLGGYFTSFNGVPRRGIVRLLADGQVDETFDPGTGIQGGSTGRVETILLQDDGRILIGGFFTNVNGVARRCIARLLRDGQVDSSFDPGIGPTGGESAVYTLARGVEGTVLVGGSFSEFNQVLWRGMVRLDSQGRIDPAYGVPRTTTYPFPIYAILEPDSDRFIAGGRGGFIYFPVRRQFPRTTYGIADYEARGFVAQDDGDLVVCGSILGVEPFVLRYLRDGTLDPAFSFRPPSGTARAVALVPDECGRLLLGGTFWFRVRADDGNIVQPRTGVIRLHRDGSIDPKFLSVRASGQVNALAVSPDGGIYAAGDFSYFGDFSRRGIVRVRNRPLPPALSAKPSPVAVVAGQTASFNPAVSNCVTGFFQWFLDGMPVAHATNRVLTLSNPPPSAAGLYSLVASNASGAVTSAPASLHVRRSSIQPGQIDVDFFPGPGVSPQMVQPDFGSDLPVFSNPSRVRCLLLQPDGKLVIGGYFSKVWGVRRAGIARLHPDGSLDEEFNRENLLAGSGSSSEPPSVTALALAPDGSVVAGGEFYVPTFAGANLAWFSPSGGRVMDTNLVQRGYFYPINALAVERDGVIAIANGLGGILSEFVRMRPNGLVGFGLPDPRFRRVGTDGTISTLALQEDGRMLLAGNFTTIRTTNTTSVARVARLLTNNVVDASFNPGQGPNATVNRVAPLADGRILIAGAFTAVDGHPSPFVARLHSDGRVDTSFRAQLTGDASGVIDLAVAPDGRIYVCGQVSPPSDTFTNFPNITRRFIFRLLPDGEIDPEFDTVLGTNGRRVVALAVDPYGRLYAGGWFDTYMTYPRSRIVRIHGGVRAMEPRLGADGYSFRVMTTEGWRYHLERCDALASAPWMTLTNLAGNGALQRLADPAEDAPRRFYRVRVE